jgi:hypothetical protein
MTSEEFLRMLETYGADPARWPVGQRQAALRCSKTPDPEIRAAWQHARSLDTLLDTLEHPPVTRALQSRVMATIPRPSASVLRRHPWWSGAGLIGVATAGVAMGMLFVSILTAPIYQNTPAPGSPDGAVSYREDAFNAPTIAPSNDVETH